MDSDPGPVILGLQALCICLTVPGVLGVLVGYLLRGRVERLGWRWALLPGAARRLVESIQSMLETEDQ